MAPELLKDDEVYTTAVDVYAFSILAYEIVTRKEPFSELGENISPFAFAQKVIKGIRPRFTDGITRKMKNLLRKCWSDDPSERPSFEEIFNELSDLSYFDETLDEDENETYIERLKEASEIDRNDQVFNLQKKLEKNEKEKDELKKEVSKLKKDLKKLQDEVNSFKSSEDDFIHVLHALHGCEIEKNLKRALFILKKMSEKGDMNASYLAGLLYERGEGVGQDFNTAKKFYLKSVKQGNSHGYNRIGYCYKNGFGIDPNNSKAFEYHQKAADLGNADALSNIGFCYEHEIGVKKDYTKAFEYFKKAASLGNSHGLSNLGLCYEDGTGVDQDFSKAVKYLKEAANLGCPISSNRVGLYYEEGKGVEKD